LLEDILNNLISNAVKFTEDGTITLSAEKINVNKKPFIKIVVADTGIGIPEEKQQLVWQEFRQASEGLNRSFEGTGLGLSITKKYIALLGGEISLSSKENEGTTFTIKLPLQKADTVMLNSSPDSTANVDNTIRVKTPNTKPRILYVEDDIVALKFINLALKSRYDVETAFKAKDALELVAVKQYDLLMLDINLGIGMDGLQLLQEIRKIDYYKNIPVIAVTAYAADSDKKEFLTKGFDKYISKPFTQAELHNLLESILQV
jgi:CheY-like chemotaxis protein/anti-sigma regulatory factor (Ser/Thr protein kinase)